MIIKLINEKYPSLGYTGAMTKNGNGFTFSGATRLEVIRKFLNIFWENKGHKKHFGKYGKRR